MKNKLLVAGLLLCSTQLRAQEQTQHVESPFSGVTAGGCAEEVALSGTIEGTINISTSAKDQNSTLTIQVGPRSDAQAVGMTTGTRYNVVGHTFRQFRFNGEMSSMSLVSQFKVVGLLTFHYTYRVAFDSDQLKASVDSFRASCTKE